MIEKKLFSLKGFQRLDVIKGLPFEVIDWICSTHDCDYCPLAVIFKSKFYCSDMEPFYSVEGLLILGGKFTQSEEVINEAES